VVVLVEEDIKGRVVIKVGRVVVGEEEGREGRRNRH
jgi:hypothetical protein